MDFASIDLEISIHVPREGDDEPCDQIRSSDSISIHVPREGDDQHRYQDDGCKCYFNPRPP